MNKSLHPTKWLSLARCDNYYCIGTLLICSVLWNQVNIRSCMLYVSGVKKTVMGFRFPMWICVCSCAVWLLNLTDDLEKQQGSSHVPHQTLCLISSHYVNSNWSYSPETAKLGFDLCSLDFWSLTLTFCVDIISVIGNNSWKFHDDTMKGNIVKKCDGRTERQDHSSSCLVAAIIYGSIPALYLIFQVALELCIGLFISLKK